MSNLTNQQKRLLTCEITALSMEYLTGLDEKYKSIIQKIARRFFRKNCKGILRFIKPPHKERVEYCTKKQAIERLIVEQLNNSQHTNLERVFSYGMGYQYRFM